MKIFFILALAASAASAQDCSAQDFYWTVGQSEVDHQSSCCGLYDDENQGGFDLAYLKSILPCEIYDKCEQDFIAVMVGTEDEVNDFALGTGEAQGRQAVDICNGEMTGSGPSAWGARRSLGEEKPAAGRMNGGMTCWDSCSRAQLAETVFLKCALDEIDTDFHLCPYYLQLAG